MNKKTYSNFDEARALAERLLISYDIQTIIDLTDTNEEEVLTELLMLGWIDVPEFMLNV